MSTSTDAEPNYLHRISHKRIDPPALTAQTPLPQLVEEAFLSYNAGRLREACRLFVSKMLADDATVGLSLSGALTPAGLGISCLVPLLEAGFIDWIVSTGANLYHDTHFALGMDMHQSRPGLDDLKLREHQVIRIYDIVFDYENLLGTDRFYRKLCRGESFQRTMGTAEFHHQVGKYLAAHEDQAGGKHRSMLAAAYRYGSYTDPVGTVAPDTVDWDFNFDGHNFNADPNAHGTLTPTYDYDTPGTYLVGLRIIDSNGDTRIGTMYVTVNDPGPSANAGADQSVNKGATVYFSGTASDPGGGPGPLQVEWDFNYDQTTFAPDPAATGTLTPTHEFDTAGDYLVAL